MKPSSRRGARTVKASSRRGARTREATDFETVRQIAMSLPDVKESITGWGWSFKVRGKLLACPAINRSAERGSLVVKIDFEDRARLLADEPDTFYLTAHYAPYPTVLIRLAKISRARMRAVLQMGWRFVTQEKKS